MPSVDLDPRPFASRPNQFAYDGHLLILGRHSRTEHHLKTAERDTDLLSLADELGAKISRLGFIFRRTLYGREVSVQRVRVLSHIMRRGPLRVSELALEEDVTQPTMTSMVSGLERHGWVRRMEDVTDKRAVLVEVTPAGRRIVYANRKARTARIAAEMSELHPEVIAEIQTILPGLNLLMEIFDDPDRLSQ
jgi:DNA-binding MarR family transcriptional regulator